MLPPLTVHLADEAATLALGARLAATLGPGMSVHLCGALGSGKTTLARGVLRGLGYAGKVKSPTYALVELYNLSRLNLYHFDFYRFNDPRAWRESGFREHFHEAALCLVEWPERAGGLLPAPDLRITLALAPDGRDATIEACTEAGHRCLSAIAQAPVADGSAPD